MTGIILSGGKNVRMKGENKAFVTINGEFIIDRTIRIFRDVFDEIILVTNSPLEYLDYDIEIVTDIIKEKAAIGGIYTGLFYASSDYCFVAACDMPFLNQRFIEYMITAKGGYDIIVPEATDGLQPLHAVYSKKCMPTMKHLIESDALKIRPLYKKLKTLKITADIITSYDNREMMFFNVNSEEDLDKISMKASQAVKP